MESGIGEFLRARRARTTPADVGLRPGPGQRRVPGLRREELAQVIGLSVDYYVRLEQGRRANVSDAVLEAIARALHLTADERAHLFALARQRRPGQWAGQEGAGQGGTGRGAARARPVEAGVRELLDQMERVPALVLGRRTDVLAWNAAADAVFAMSAREPSRRNAARDVFSRPEARSDYLDWEHLAGDVVAHLRLDAGRHPGDPLLAALVGELSITSPRFRELWARHDVRQKTAGLTRLTHPLVGELALSYQALSLSADPDQLVVAYTAARGSATEERLALLMSWTADAVPDAAPGRAREAHRER